MRPAVIGPQNLIGDDCAIQDDFVDTSVVVSLPSTVSRRTVASDLVKQASKLVSKSNGEWVSESDVWLSP